jgi:hypothetical protein
MSIRLVKEEIKRFLNSPEPEVLCIKGKWGVGKTFTWNEYLKQAVKDNKVSLQNYSYVSLFGQNSLEDLKYAIFENIDSLYQRNIKSFLSKGYKLSTNIPNIKGFKNILPDKGVLFSVVRNQLICIDDLDRAGDNISVKNVLGLTSFLKEQRKCKLVLILNNEVLTEESKKEFVTHLEKVIDVEMNFIPTPAEAVDIAVDRSASFAEQFSKLCVTLGITNIRVIRKIQRLGKELEKLLENHDRRVFESALTSITIFGWIFYQQKDDSIPPVSFIKDFSFFSLEKKEKEEEKQWRALISSLNFTHVDDFDQLLFDSVEKGFFDPEEIEKRSKQADSKLSLDDKTNSFHKAWDKYHGSFKCNEAEILDEMFESFKNNVQAINPTNADHTISFLRKYDRTTQADELIDFYMKNRNEERKFYDSNYSHFLDIKDPAFLKVFKDKLASFKDPRTPKEIIMKIAKDGGWGQEDLLPLVELSSDDYYKLFKEEEGDDLRIIASQVVKFGRYGDASENMKKISLNAQEALKKIAGECRINEERVKSFGISKDSE